MERPPLLHLAEHLGQLPAGVDPVTALIARTPPDYLRACVSLAMDAASRTTPAAHNLVIKGAESSLETAVAAGLTGTYTHAARERLERTLAPRIPTPEKCGTYAPMLKLAHDVETSKQALIRPIRWLAGLGIAVAVGTGISYDLSVVVAAENRQSAAVTAIERVEHSTKCTESPAAELDTAQALTIGALSAVGGTLAGMMVPDVCLPKRLSDRIARWRAAQILKRSTRQK